jgi:hypothetical protein
MTKVMSAEPIEPITVDLVLTTLWYYVDEARRRWDETAPRRVDMEPWMADVLRAILVASALAFALLLLHRVRLLARSVFPRARRRPTDDRHAEHKAPCSGRYSR